MAELPSLLTWYLVFLFSTTFHEFAHAWAAYRGGDPTAYEGGHVTLDPIPHIRRSPIGMVVIPIISYLQLGWMVGFASVPFNPLWGRRHPTRQALMSLAGPCANLLLALLAIGLMRGLVALHVLRFVSYPAGTHLVEPVAGRSMLGALALALGVMLNLNVILFLFNLIPIPPLDGAGVLEGALPRTMGPVYTRLRELPAFGLLGLLLAWQVFPYVASPAFRFFAMLLYT